MMAAKQIESAKYTEVSRKTPVLASTAASCAMSISPFALLRRFVKRSVMILMPNMIMLNAKRDASIKYATITWRKQSASSSLPRDEERKNAPLFLPSLDSLYSIADRC